MSAFLGTGVSIAVLGAGNWGTTIAHIVAGNGRDVLLWTRDDAQCGEINTKHTNTRSVPGLAISPRVQAVTTLSAAVRGVSLVVMAIPSQAFREVCRGLGEHLAPEQMVIHATKGLERTTHCRMTEVLLEETCARQVGVLATCRCPARHLAVR